MKVRFLALAAAGVATAGLVASSAGASATSATTPHGWPTFAGGTTAAAPITTGRTITVISHEERFKGVKAGDHFGPGSYFVFEESLRDPGSGKKVGTDSVQCVINFRTFICNGSLFLYGKGSVTIDSALKGNPLVLAVAGGTGNFQNARGQMTVQDLKHGNSRLTLHLIP